MKKETSQALFTYGTLQFAQVLEELQIKYTSREPAAVIHFAARRIPNGDFEDSCAAVPSTGKLEGYLLEGVSKEQLAFLDFYVGDSFRRILVNTIAPRGIQTAFMYVWADLSKQLREPWSAETFTRVHLPEVVRHLQVSVRKYALEEDSNYRQYVKPIN